MKKTIFYLVSTLLLLTTQSTFAQQLESGNYVYENDSCKVEFTVTDWGNKISNFKFSEKATGFVSMGEGVYREQNGITWYQVETLDCNYEFEYPFSPLRITSYDCLFDEPNTYVVPKKR